MSGTEPITVLFCGRGHFADGYIYTSLQLADESPDIVVKDCEREDVPTEIVTATVIIPLMTRITRDLIEKAKNLKMIMQYGAGVEGIDITAASEYGIYVCNIPTDACANALSCAEHCIFLALATLRDYKGLQYSLQTGRLGFPSGRNLFSSSVCIIGFGGIGIQLAYRLKPFMVDTHVIVRNPKQHYEKHNSEILQLITSVNTIDDWEALGPNIDIVFLCCPLTQENRGIIDKKFLSYIKPGAIIINVARGGLLNYEDCLEALNSGVLGGIGLDVFHTEPFPDISTDPILSHPHVISTPHVAGVSKQSYDDMSKIVANNVRNLKNKLTLSGVLNRHLMS